MTTIHQLRRERDELKDRVQYLEGLINTPEIDDFMKAIPIEAAHQIERWGIDHDAHKGPADWFWTVGYLAGKALASHIAGDTSKAKHHCVTVAALCLTWHKQLTIDEQSAIVEDQHE